MLGGGEVALLVALEFALEGVDGGGGGAGGDGGGWGLLLRLSVCGFGGEAWLSVVEGALDGEALLRGRCGGCEVQASEVVEALDGRAVGSEDLHAEEVAGGVFLEAHHHGFEEFEGLLLVLDEGVLLTVAAQADAFLEVVHVEEVLFPESVEDGEHDDALVVAELDFAEDFFLGVIALVELVEDGVAEFVTVELCGIDLAFELCAEDVVDLGEDLLGVPLLGMDFLGGVLVEDAGEDGGDVVFCDELLLRDAFHELAAEGVDGLALLVHDVVVLEDVLAGFEVLAFDGLLRAFDALGDHAAFDGHSFFHAERLEQAGDPLAREDAHEVVFEGEEEARGTGVALTAGAATELVVDAARLVALGAEDVQAAGFNDGVVLGLGGGFVGGDGGVPVLLRDFELLRLVVEADEAGGRYGRDGAFGGGDCAGGFTLDEVLLGHEFRVAAEEDVGTTTGHVGGDGDHAEAAGLGYDFGFLLVEFCVEDDVADGLALEDLGEEFGLFDAGGTDEDRLLGGVETLDFVGYGEVFFLGGAEDDVGVFDALHDAVGGDDDDVELVDVLELGSLGFGGAGHAGELFVEAEVVLEGDGREGLVFLADLDAFFGFDGLVEAVGPAAAGHEAAGELVDDNDLAVLDYVLYVALVEGVGLDGDFDVVLHVPVFRVGDVADAEELFYLLEAFVGDGDGAGFFVDDVVTGPGLGFEGLDELALFELRDDGVGDGVLVGGLVGGAGDDEGGAGFVDEDGVDFVDDAVEVAALDLVGDLELHVVAEVIETELVVGAVGDVGAVGGAAFGVGEVVDDDAYGEAEEAIDLAHPFGVALGEVVVDGDDVDAVAGERVEVAGKRGDEGLAFAGLHLGDFALVEGHAADHLDVEVAHADGAAAGFADDGEGFGEELVEDGFFGSDTLLVVGDAFEGGGDAGAEFDGLSGELFVGEGLGGFVEAVDLGEHGKHALDGAFVGGAEDFGESLVEHGGFLWMERAWALKMNRRTYIWKGAAGRRGGVV